MSHNIDDLLEEIEILKGYKIMYQNLSEQNKRYREALMTIAVGDDHFAKYEDIARDALEAEK